MPHDPSPWWHPDIHADRRPFLVARNRIIAAIRSWFADRDFIEADCGALQISPGNETHLHAFATEFIDSEGRRLPRYLHTSPEFACKKLLAAGEARIFAMAHAFRNRERTPTHAPEFTMLEWYRAGESYHAIMWDCADLLRVAAEAAGGRLLSHRGVTADAFREPDRITVTDAFRKFAGINLMAVLGDRNGFAAAAAAAGIRVVPDDSWSDIFSRVIVEMVEPHLGQGRAAFLYDYPLAEAALARPSDRDPRLAERFELYACGIELANGFGELTDAEEQRRRFVSDMALKQELYGESYPIDETFLAALSTMPQASGVALGLDRLVMLATGAGRIDRVIWTPFA
ncbi:EF-P lysine aminoacylase EpmA [soil metagenome]